MDLKGLGRWHSRTDADSPSMKKGMDSMVRRDWAAGIPGIWGAYQDFRC
jgi:hypothetical protein